MTHCRALQQNDEMFCAECNLRWDVNDIDPPRCKAGEPFVVGLCGPKTSGKSTVADVLVRERGYRRVSMAEPMKKMVSALMCYTTCNPWVGWQDEWLYGDRKETPCKALCGQTPRHTLQTLGTEWGRECLGEDFWVRIAQERIAALGGFVVIDDIRFENEAALCDILVRVERPGCGGEDGHSSETGEGLLPDVTIYNTQGVEELKLNVRYLKLR